MIRGLILVLALAAGGIAAWLSLGAQAPATQTAAATAPAPKIELQEILVAAVNLKEGQTLIDTDLRWQPWPDAAMSTGLLTRSDRPDVLETFAGLVVRDNMLAGEPIREEKLAPAGSGFLSAILPAGMRAVAVAISAETTAGGFIRPHDRVDVIATRRDTAASRTFLTNIKVLAIDQNADESHTEGASVGKTATLELDPTQAEAVASAEASGALSLALRSSADTDEAPTMALATSAETVRILRAGRSETVSTQ